MKSTIESILQFKTAGRATTSSISWDEKLCTKRQSSSFLSALPIEWKSLTNPPTHNGRMEQNPQSDSIFPLSNQLVSSSRVKFVRKVIGKISNHFSVNRKISEISFGSFTAGGGVWAEVAGRNQSNLSTRKCLHASMAFSFV